MILPKDWDKPSEQNPQLCALFTRNVFQAKDIQMPYRLFVSDEADRNGSERLPLVLYLHGADAVGSDNDAPLAMHDVGTMFAGKELRKKHPCHILAPQYGRGQHWSISTVSNAVLALVRFVVERLNADPARIYLYGYSAGGVGVLRLIKENPGMFAAAISVCGATSHEHLSQLSQTPLWMLHAADDEIVRDSYVTDGDSSDVVPYHLGSGDIYRAFSDITQKIPLLGDVMPAYSPELFQRDKSIIYTQLPQGWMRRACRANPHCSWVVLSDPRNAIFTEWLFSHENK